MCVGVHVMSRLGKSATYAWILFNALSKIVSTEVDYGEIKAEHSHIISIES